MSQEKKINIMTFFSDLLIKLLLVAREIPWKLFYKLYRIKYKMPRYVRFNGPGILITGDGVVECNGDVYFSYYSRIFVDSDTKIKIGSNVSLGHYLKIYTSDIDSQDFILNGGGSGRKIKKNVTIGDNVLIGPNVFINKGTVISNNTIVVANSVLSGSYEGYSIVAGNPAKVVKIIENSTII